jgi:hypothetical protein
MKTFRLFIAVLMLVPVISCTAQPSDKQTIVDDNNSDKIEAYYFHFPARCTTCKTIEASAKENLETIYPNQFKQGLITFQSVNLEEAGNKPLADRHGFSGQDILFVKEDKKINLTNEGPLYAVDKPEKFRR